ncbi:hypothetical protein [uncultured Eubacterium sp.]|uniref:hypothetical protein n=1 Tax=uncultured Eubacterium sp. TaxID=165185 RepID=UPI0026DC6466|nr:hypothetical protein [uncultured Eubacterium sp.]
MRTTLITVLENNVQRIVIPAFGGCCGTMKYQELCKKMYEGYKQIMNLPSKLNWEYATR